MVYQGEAWMGYDCRFCQQLISLFHGLKLILLCGTRHLLERQKQPVAATALVLPTNRINANGHLLLTTTKHLILSQFAKHGILTGCPFANFSYNHTQQNYLAKTDLDAPYFSMKIPSLCPSGLW